MKTRKTTKITKSQLVNELSEYTTISKVQCDFMFDSLLAIVKEHVLNEQEVELKTLGRFELVWKPARPSNMTGEMIPAHKQLRFKVADRLSRVVRVGSREY
jgi:nucleoid DNA-binding protein